MKCAILAVQNIKTGSSLTVMECGGVTVHNGDNIVVPVAIAKRMMLQHGPFLKFNGECERNQLPGGHYGIEKSMVVVDEPVVVETKKKSETTVVENAVVEPDEMTEPAPVPLETPAERADDRSMFGRGRRRKKRE